MKQFIEKLFNLIVLAWTAGNRFIKNHGADAIDLTDKIKEAVDSDIADRLVEIIPGDWDNKALAWAREAAPIAADAVGMVVECDIDEGPVAWLQCVVDGIKEIDEKRRAGFYRDLAAQLALAKAKVENDDHKLTLANVNLAIELEYNRLKTD